MKMEVAKEDAGELIKALSRGPDTIVLFKGVGVDRRMALGILEVLESLKVGETIALQYEAWQMVG